MRCQAQYCMHALSCSGTLHVSADMVQVLALKTAEEAQKDAEYLNGHDRKRQRTEASVPGLDMSDDEDEVGTHPLASSVDHACSAACTHTSPT